MENPQQNTGKFSYIHMSGGKNLQNIGEVNTSSATISEFDYNTWRSNLDSSLQRRTIRRTGNKTNDLIHLLTSTRYRRGPRRFFELNEGYYRNQIHQGIQFGLPLEFILPSFPVKCFNPLKVRRRTPDLAEVGCLSQLYSLCRNIEQIYDLGARFILITDGLVYAPIFEEPREHAENYRKELRLMIGNLGMRDFIRTRDMTGLIENRQNVFDTIYDENRNQIAQYWKTNPDDPHIRKLIENTMTNINLTMYEEEDLRDVFVHHRNPELESEIRSRARKSAFAYLVFLETIRNMNLLGSEFPDGIRVTCHPKEGQLGLNLIHPRSSNFPWNGVGLLRRDGSVRVRYEDEVRRDPQYIPVFIQGEEFPFYYEESQ